MDELFVEMFGVWADSIYHYIGKSFDEEINESQEMYEDKEEKRNLISRLIVEKFQLDTVWFD